MKTHKNIYSTKFKIALALGFILMFILGILMADVLGMGISAYNIELTDKAIKLANESITGWVECEARAANISTEDLWRIINE